MKVRERLVDDYSKEGVLLEYVEFTKEFQEVKDYVLHKGEKLDMPNILRASKSVLLNLDHIVSVRPALNGRLYAKMENGEDVLISRKYAKQIAKHIMEGEYEGI